MEGWFAGVSQWLAANPAYLGIAILLVACGECLAIVGLLVPGTVLLFALAVLAGGGVLSLGQTLLMAYAGGLLGDMLSYLVGRHLHQNIRGLPYLRDHPQWLVGAEQYFQRYGIASLLVGRFIGPLRPFLPMVAGMCDMPALRFFLVSALASVGWSVAYLLPGWTAGAALRLPLPTGFWSEAALLAGAVAVLIGLALHGSLHEKRRASQLPGGFSLLLLVALLCGWSQLAEFDQGLLALLQTGRSIELDRFMVLITRLGDWPVQFAAGLLLMALLLLMRQTRATLFVGVSLGLTAVLNGVLKFSLERVRPQLLLEPLSSYSLPSGHSSAAFALMLALGVLAGRGQPARWRVTWLLLAGLPAAAVALSRVYLGVHWPTDIIAGALLAGSSCALALVLVQRERVLPALGARLWWLLLPALLAVFGSYLAWELPAALSLYRY